MTTPAPRLSSTFDACLLAGALGDALGYQVEFDTLSVIDARVGRELPPRLRLGAELPVPISDDTQMTLFTGEGLLRAEARGRRRGGADQVQVLAHAYRRWLYTQALQGPPHEEEGWLLRVPELYARRAPGATCLAALSSLDGGGRLGDVLHPPNDSKGCGAVMRIAPIGLAMDEPEAAFALARDSAVLTHGHPSGYLSAAYGASLICDLCRGRSFEEAMARADELLARENGCEEMQAILERTRDLALGGAPSPEGIESLGGGWVGEEALAIALWCVLTVDGDGPMATKECLWRATLHSGDSDSTAAIAGNLLGARLGRPCLPADWLAELELVDEIESLSRDLYRAFGEGGPIDPRRYPPR